MDQLFINRIVEAALLASNQPVTVTQLQGLFPEDQPPPNGAILQALETLREACADRGVELVEVASGFRFQIKADVHPWVARLWTERPTRYTRATLETLALIAYRQPITRGEIEQVRGVAVSSNIIKALEEREWIRVVGHRDVPGKPALFGTTKAFLDYFGLKRLDELPPLSELKDIGELEPQLPLGEAPIPAAAARGGHPGDGAPQAANDALTSDADNADEDGNADPDAGSAPGTTHHDESPAIGPADEADSTTPDTEEPEAAPGERAADENDHEPDNAVETTTVPESQAEVHEDTPELQK